MLKINHDENNIKENEAEISELENLIKENETEISELEKKINDSKEQLINETKKFDKLKKEIARKINDCEDKIDKQEQLNQEDIQNKNNIYAVKAKLTYLLSELEILKSDKDTINIKINCNDICNDINKLQNKKECVSEKLTIFKKKEAELSADVENTISEIKKLESKSLDIKDKSLYALIDKLKKDVKNKKLEIPILKQHIINCEIDIEILSKNIDRLKNDELNQLEKFDRNILSINEHEVSIKNEIKCKNKDIDELENRQLVIDQLIEQITEISEKYLYLDSELKKAILKFNKTNADIKEKIKNYEIEVEQLKVKNEKLKKELFDKIKKKF